jgi:hypothetical protein
VERLAVASAMRCGSLGMSRSAGSVNSPEDHTLGRVRAGVVLAATLLGLFGMHGLGQHGWGHPADVSEMPPHPVAQASALQEDESASVFGDELSTASTALGASTRPAAVALDSPMSLGISPPSGSLRDLLGVCLALLTVMLLTRRLNGARRCPRWRRLRHRHTYALARTSRVVGGPNRVALAVYRC